MTTDSNHPKGYAADPFDLPGRGFPRGPLGHVESPQPTAIGFCPMCGSNARRTTVTRGTFDCPTCTFQWYDERVGEHPHDIEEFFSNA